MKIIINADDLGYSDKENRAIFSLLDQKKLTSTTIMTNAPAFEKAASEVLLRQSDKKISFGIHLNLTEFTPLTRSNIFEELGHIDTSGKFCASHLRSLNSVQKKAFKIACLKELEEQTQKALDYRLSISHFDSHNHIHTRPELLFILNKLMIRFGINKWRITKNWYELCDKPSPVLRMKKLVWDLYLRYVCLSKTTNYFTDFISFIKTTDANKVIVGGGRMINNQTVIELMTHPGKDWSMEETAVLKTDWTRTLPFPVEFISYNDL